jgi:hypothetical protein
MEDEERIDINELDVNAIGGIYFTEKEKLKFYGVV